MAGKHNKQKQESDDKPTNRKDNELAKKPVETGGPKGPEPTRYGDWERRGRCIDF